MLASPPVPVPPPPTTVLPDEAASKTTIITTSSAVTTAATITDSTTRITNGTGKSSAIEEHATLGRGRGRMVQMFAERYLIFNL